MHEYGLQIASPGTARSASTAAIDANRSDLTLRDVRSLTSADVFVTGLPGLYYRLIKTDGNTRTLANPHLRTSDGVASSARFGEDVPVPSVTFTPIASGGVNQQPITSFTYRTVGVNIELTPRLHHDDDISLRLKLEVSSLSGVGFNNLPTFGTRYVETTIRLRDGETNLLAGLIRDEERTTLEGHPRAERHPDRRPAVRALAQRNQADRHRADADAADRPRARPGDRRPAPVPGRARLRAAASTSCRCRWRSRCRPPPPQDDDAGAPASIFPPGTPTGPPGQVRPAAPAADAPAAATDDAAAVGPDLSPARVSSAVQQRLRLLARPRRVSRALRGALGCGSAEHSTISRSGRRSRGGAGVPAVRLRASRCSGVAIQRRGTRAREAHRRDARRRSSVARHASRRTGVRGTGAASGARKECPHRPRGASPAI